MSDGAFELVWHSPALALMALLALALLAMAMRLQRKGSANAHAQSALQSQFATPRPGGMPKSFAVAWICASLALGSPSLTTPRPQHSHEDQTSVRDVALVLDISPSMALTDLAPSRLKRAQWKAEQLLVHVAQARFGLVVFSANAYVALPLTLDREAVLSFVKAVDPDMVTRRGSNIQRALDLAQNMLSDSRSDSRAIVLLSDGDFDPAIDTIPPGQIPTFVIGIGSDAGAPVTTAHGQALVENGRQVVSRLEAGPLRALADRSGGLYQTVQADDADSRRLVARLNELAADHVALTPAGGAVSLSRPLLVLSVVFFFVAQFGLPRRATQTALVALGLAVAESANAGSLKEHAAWHAFSDGDYASARELYARDSSYSSQLGRGAAAYRVGDWQESLFAFELAQQSASTDEQRAKAAFNQGNAWVQLGNREAAIAAYRAALRYAPGYTRAGLNLEQLTLPPRGGAQAQQHTGASRTTAGDDPSADGTDNRACAAPPCVGAQPTAADAARAQNSAATTPRDAVKELLTRRFSRQDYTDGLSRGESRPW